MYCWIPTVAYTVGAGVLMATHALGFFNTATYNLLLVVLSGLIVMNSIRLVQYKKGMKELKGGKK
jgi:hypothetical protein